MALEPSRPTQLSAAIVRLSSLARSCGDRVWQRQLLELAAACSAYSKVPRPDDQTRILNKARGLVTAATQLGEVEFASAASAVIAALTAPAPGEPPQQPERRATPSTASTATPSASTTPLSAPATPPIPSADTSPLLAPATAPLAPGGAAPRVAPGGRSAGSASPPRPASPPHTTFGESDGKITEPLGLGRPRGDEPLVVVVDRDPQSRGVLATYFGKAGFRVAAFDDGAPAMARIQAERPALVVADLILPKMPGETLILALRRSPATATLPILVVTAEPWRLGPEHEVQGVLTKPVNVMVVVKAARRLVSASSGTDALRAARR